MRAVESSLIICSNITRVLGNCNGGAPGCADERSEEMRKGSALGLERATSQWMIKLQGIQDTPFITRKLIAQDLGNNQGVMEGQQRRRFHNTCLESFAFYPFLVFLFDRTALTVSTRSTVVYLGSNIL